MKKAPAKKMMPKKSKPFPFVKGAPPIPPGKKTDTVMPFKKGK